jgi:hypothetical protein
MTLHWKPATLTTAGFLLLTGALLALTPSTALAQCGSQASSCKNCHEVQAQLPVNAQGDWHISHAFGDFCQFCHAGNVQATEAELAHQGMVSPLADPQASCSSCHPTDARDLAVVYGTALGVEVGSGGSAVSEATAAPTDAPAAGPDAPGEPPAAEIVDYNAQYAETAEERPVNPGNLILAGVIGTIALGGGGYILRRERQRGGLLRASRAIKPEAGSLTEADRPATASPAEALRPVAEPAPAPSAEPEPLFTALAALDTPGRQALAQLLRDPQTASDLLRRLARLDPEVLRTLRSLDRETRALLLALTSD